MLKQRKILVVDDAKEMLVYYSDILRAAGFEVLATDDWEKCLNMAKNAKPDLILLDIIMPAMDGGTLARQLLENGVTGDIPIVFLTSMISEAEADATLHGSGRMYISKSAPPREAVKKIREILDKANPG